MSNIKEFIEYAKQRSVESKGTNYEWDFNKLYPNENEIQFFLSVIEQHPRYTIVDDNHWDDIIDWFENLESY